MGDDYTIQPYFNIPYVYQGSLEDWGLKQKKIGGDASPVCVSETVAGDTFSLAKPAISREEERDLIASLRQILSEEGGL
jgi:hypothetical protein